ncbi:hypothetical protein KFE25_005213 [Diacronema lutheri]|uniref:Uncharacterized protein n=2 Tax=Diacronema lutheri TaxID=2081491 RepID=A0A8J5X225_DIALT|nr:hypothetical protein KFE25_005213 [Diacronema lutheri]
MWRPGEHEPPSAVPAAAAAPAASPAKPAISSKLLGMKFMQRRQEADLRGRLRAEEAARADEARWSARAAAGGGAATRGGAVEQSVPGEPRVQLEAEAHAAAATSRAPASVAKALLAFRPARRSFGDFNPKTASALAAVREAQDTARAALDEAAAAAHAAAAVDPGGYDEGTVGDEEMAERYATLVGRKRATQPATELRAEKKRKAGAPEEL